MEGPIVGRTEGTVEWGDLDGTEEGVGATVVGRTVGNTDGLTELGGYVSWKVGGTESGNAVGASEGTKVGAVDGIFVSGAADVDVEGDDRGDTVRVELGRKVGIAAYEVGAEVDWKVGAAVGVVNDVHDWDNSVVPVTYPNGVLHWPEVIVYSVYDCGLHFVYLYAYTCGNAME